MLQTVVNLALQIQRDERRDESALRHRDRDIGKSLSHLSAKPVRQLAAWLDCVSVEEDRSKASYAVHALQMVVIVLFLLGSLTGSGAAAAAFYYDGQHPINILPVLAVFVFLPVVMLLPFSIAILPRSWVYRWPTMSALQESLAMMLVGIMGIVTRTLPQPYREALQQTAGRSEAYRRVYGHIQKWMLLQWSQTFALAFMLGALTWFGYRLAVTDLAFTWSTTIQTEQPEALYARVQRLTNILSAPWAACLPQAQPTGHLIRQTRYYRLQEGVLPDRVSPAVLGGWWPFLMLSMVCYGMLPRILTLLFCAWRYQIASRWCLLHTPGAAEILDRLNSVMIETRSPTTEAIAVQPTTISTEAPIEEHVVEAVSRAIAINWSAVPVNDARVCQLLSRQLAIEARQPLHAGGRNTLAEDADVIAQVTNFLRDAEANSRFRSQQVILLVKAWEPPMLEMIDFLQDLRHAIGDGVRILVAALWMQPNDGVSENNAATYIDQWQRKLATVGDAWLQVCPLTLDVHAVQDRVDVLTETDNKETADE
jgi:hypothetical protein